MSWPWWSHLRAWGLDAWRRRLLPASARRPGVGQLRWGAVLGPIGVVGVLVWLGWWAGVALRAGGVELEGAAAAGLELLLVLALAWVAAVFALAVLLELEPAGAMEFLPVLPPLWRLAPRLLAGFVAAGGWFTALVSPGFALAGGVLGWSGWQCVGACLTLAACATALTAGGVLAGAGLARAAGARRPQLILALAAVVGGCGFLAVLALAPPLARGEWVATLASLGSWVHAWAGGVPPRLVATATGFAGAMGAMAVATVVAVGAAVAASCWLAHDGAENGGTRGGRRPRREGVGWLLLSGDRLIRWPLVRFELVATARNPARLARELLGTVVAFAVVGYVFAAKAAAVAVTAAFFVPVGLAGAASLHGVGRDGTLVTWVALAGRAREYLLTKLVVAVGVATAGALVATAGLWGLRGKLLMDEVALASALALLPAAVVGSASWAVGLGAVLADRGVKRLFPDRGVGVLGELAYWAAGGALAVACYLIWRGAAGGSGVALLVGLMATGALAVGGLALLWLGEQRLVEQEG